jgi:hypothetical protein
MLNASSIGVKNDLRIPVQLLRHTKAVYPTKLRTKTIGT